MDEVLTGCREGVNGCMRVVFEWQFLLEEREALNLVEPLSPWGPLSFIHPWCCYIILEVPWWMHCRKNRVSELLALDWGLKCKYSRLCCSAALFTLASQSEAANSFRVREHRPLKAGSSSTGASTSIRRNTGGKKGVCRFWSFTFIQQIC